MASVLCACITEDDSSEEMESLRPGDELPEFSVALDDGSRVEKSDLRGKVSIMVFFRTTCPDCQREFPVLQRLYDKYGAAENIRFVLISAGEEEASIEAYWAESDLSMPFSVQEDKSLSTVFRVNRIPQVYVSDVSATIRFVHSDNPIATYEQLEGEVLQLLSE